MLNAADRRQLLQSTVAAVLSSLFVAALFYWVNPPRFVDSSADLRDEFGTLSGAVDRAIDGDSATLHSVEALSLQVKGLAESAKTVETSALSCETKTAQVLATVDEIGRRVAVLEGLVNKNNKLVMDQLDGVRDQVAPFEESGSPSFRETVMKLRNDVDALKEQLRKP